MYYLKAEGMNVLDDTQCSLQIPFSLVCGLCWGCSLAATGYGQRSFLRNRHLSRRHLSPRRLPFWILVRPLGLKLPLVRIHCQGEYEVRFYVPVHTGRRPEVYQHLRPLPHTLGKLLWLVLQHGCSGIPSEAREGDLMNRLPPPRWSAPHSMEPETLKPEGSQWFTSFLHGLLASCVQEDRVRHGNCYHVTHLRDGDQYEAGGIQLVR